MTWTPLTPDAPPQTTEYLAVVIVDDQEHGVREQINICSTYEAARQLGAAMAAHAGGDARYVILRRTVGSWEECP